MLNCVHLGVRLKEDLYWRDKRGLKQPLLLCKVTKLIQSKRRVEKLRRALVGFGKAYLLIKHHLKIDLFEVVRFVLFYIKFEK